MMFRTYWKYKLMKITPISRDFNPRSLDDRFLKILTRADVANCERCVHKREATKRDM